MRPADQSFAPDAKNPISYQVNENQLLVTLGAKNYFFSPEDIQELLARHAKIIKRRERLLTYNYFLEHRTGTIPLACQCIDLAFQDVYRGASWLVENGYLVKLTRVRLPHKAGSRPVMYGLPCVTDEEIARGIIRIQASSSPAYAVVMRLVQRVWEDVEDEEVQYSKILEYARSHSQGFDFAGLAEMAARELHNRGVKVWR